MSETAARREASGSTDGYLSDIISTAIDELHALEAIASGWRTQHQTADLIDDINRVGKRLARCGRG